MLELKLIHASKRSPRQGKTSEHVDMKLQKLFAPTRQPPENSYKRGPKFLYIIW